MRQQQEQQQQQHREVIMIIQRNGYRRRGLLQRRMVMILTKNCITAVLLFVLLNCITTTYSFVVVVQQQQQQQQKSSLSSSTFIHRKQQQQQQQYDMIRLRNNNRGDILRRYVQQQQQQSSSSNIQQQSSTTPKIKKKKKYQHILAIVAMPLNSMDRILNEQILETIVPVATNKISIVLRYCYTPGSSTKSKSVLPTVPAVRRYVSEIYSQLWDCIMSYDTADPSSKRNEDDDDRHDSSTQIIIPDVVVYAPNLPNSAPESWIDIQPDLDCICSYDFITGWRSDIAPSSSISSTAVDSTSSISSTSSNNNPRGQKYVMNTGYGYGGLQEHIDAVNRERQIRNLGIVDILRPVDPFAYNQDGYSAIATDPNVHFIDDDEDEVEIEESIVSSFVSSPIVRNKQDHKLYNSVAVGGTFDGMHYGHRKLITLAVSSVQPITGRLLIGVTIDSMLQNKAYKEYIPSVEQRIVDVQNFVYRLAPGMINRIQIVPIQDKFGPPGQIQYNTIYKFDALVVSHETLRTGYELNQYRLSHNMTSLVLLCTRRTEPHSMSSTALRKIRSTTTSVSSSTE